MPAVLEAARAYLARGWAVVPIQTGSKRPVGRAWQNMRLIEEQLPEHFAGDSNVGVLLGAPSGGLIDIDLDAPQAAYLAPRFLPSTAAIFGRASKEESHWLYTVKDLPSTAQHETPAPEGAMLVELRSTGGQTVFPPSVHPSGEAIEWSGAGDPAAVDAQDLILRVGQLAAAALLARAWPERGARNKTALALAGGLLRGGWDSDRVRDFIIAVAEAAGDEEAEDRTLSINSTQAKIEAGQEATGWPALAELLGKAVVERVGRWLRLVQGTSIGGLDRTDLGNAKRLAAIYGEDLRHSPKLGWLAWDGRRWQPEADTKVHQLAEKVVDEVVREALAKPDDEQKKRHLAWAITMQSAGHLSAMVDLARYQERIAVKGGDAWDKQPLLLNCPNGTLDLEAGELREQARDDRLTKLTAAAYDPAARSPVWEKFLGEATGGDNELLEFLQQAAGYSLTGLTDEEKLFFVHGPTASGKSTFVESLKATLGDYAATTDFETFLAKKGDAGARNDIARLAWVRLVSSIEVEHGKKMAEGLVKTLTGGDVVTARFLYKELFEFRPQFKLWLVANHKPRVDDESAIWRRILIVPFEHTVPVEKRDPMIKRELTNPAKSGAAILAWAISGYYKWRGAKALVPPKRVLEATAAYREEMDPLKDFLEQVCTVDLHDPDVKVHKRDFREKYVEWCRKTSTWPLNERELKQRLLDMGVREGEDSIGRTWVGVSTMLTATQLKKEPY
jgi:putative DNA primase/helicase